MRISDWSSDVCSSDLLAVEVELQRTDTGDNVDDAGQSEPLQFGHQRMNPDAKLDVEHDCPIFDEDIPVALLPINGARTAWPFRDLGEDGRERFHGAGRRRLWHGACRNEVPLRSVCRCRIVHRNRSEAELVARGE